MSHEQATEDLIANLDAIIAREPPSAELVGTLRDMLVRQWREADRVHAQTMGSLSILSKSLKVPS